MPKIEHLPAPEPIHRQAIRHAIEFAKLEAERRRALAAQGEVAIHSPQAAASFHGDTFAPALRRTGKRGRPRKDEAAAGRNAFLPIRAWAEAVAGRLSLTQYLDMVSATARAVPDFPGHLPIYLEKAFDRLVLADGAEIWRQLR